MSQRISHVLPILVLFLLALAGMASAAEETALKAAAAHACATSASHPCLVSDFTRRPLAGDVVEYSLVLQVGPGEHDEIGLHRVVRERRPYVPVRTQDAVFLAHGDIWGFDAAFLPSVASPAKPDAAALPVFLAQRGVDVWGIDFRWALVPGDVADTRFMADWGLETHVDDLRIALAAARAVRFATGSGLGRLHLLGWSRGGQIGYAYLNDEVQRPPLLRHVKGFIPVDVYYKTDDEDLRQDACTRFAQRQDALDAGMFADPSGQLIVSVGTLAETAPNDPSPVLPGLTNYQAALVFGGATFIVFPGGLPPVPLYHFTGASFDASGLPDAFLFTAEPFWLDFLQGASPFEAMLLLADAEAVTCDEDDVPFDDHLDDVTVPVLYVAGAGGFGEFGVYSTTLLGSSDVTSLIVSLLPPEQRISDFGHADIFLADDAPDLVWQPLLEWIEDH